MVKRIAYGLHSKLRVASMCAMRMTSAATLSLALAAVSTLVAAPARAHISLDVPKARYWQTGAMQGDQTKLKTSPCGNGADARTKDASLITTYQPGEKVTVKFTETVQHPGHFEISFDTDGQDFPFPGEAPSATSGVTVLAANIPDKTSDAYTYEITLPNMECEKCTLQLVQVMTTKAPPYSKNGDLYFQCADLILKAGGGGGTGGASSGGASAGGAGGTSAAGASAGGATAGGAGGAGSAGMAGSSVSSGGAATGGGAPNGGAMNSSGGVTSGGTTASGGGSTGGVLNTGTGGTVSATGGTVSATGGTVSATGGIVSSTGGVSSPPITGEEPGCSLGRSSGSGAALPLFALSVLLGWQRRRRGRAQRR